MCSSDLILADIDVPDVPSLEPRLVRNRAHNIPRFHTVNMSDFDAVRLEFDAFRRAPRLA